jgi:mannose-6-phosphate isomerase-like protein (cupin superfamily)
MSLIGRLGKSCARTGIGNGYAASATATVVITRIKLGRRARAEDAVMAFFSHSARFSCCALRRRGATYVREGSTSVKDKGDMAQAPKPIRRVVTGNDAQGRSRVLFDSAAPNVNPGAIVRGTCMTDIWLYQHSPAPISGDRDDGNLPFHFEPPAAGGHLRIVQSPGKPRGYDPARDPAAVPLHPARRRADGVWDRGGQNAFSSPIHKSETVDYGIVLSGERVLVLDSGEIVMKPGDVVVQLGNWHGWTNPASPSLMAFVMMGAKFDE